MFLGPSTHLQLLDPDDARRTVQARGQGLWNSLSRETPGPYPAALSSVPLYVPREVLGTGKCFIQEDLGPGRFCVTQAATHHQKQDLTPLQHLHLLTSLRGTSTSYKTEDLHLDRQKIFAPRSTTKPSLTAFRVSSVVVFGAPVDLRRSVVLASLPGQLHLRLYCEKGTSLFPAAAVFLLE